MKEEVQSTKLNINKDWCKGCGICVAFCPKSVLKLDKSKVKIIDDEKCIECGMCEKLCPDYAISLAKKEG